MKVWVRDYQNICVLYTPTHLSSLSLNAQDVFLMVRREKQTIFLDATEETTVLQLKKKLEPIVKKPAEEQRLYNVDTKDALDDAKTLGDCGYKSQSARAQDPATIGLAFRRSEEVGGAGFG